jgi:hypothetical protein
MAERIANLREERFQCVCLLFFNKSIALQIVDIVMGTPLLSGRKTLFIGNNLDGAFQCPCGVKGRVPTVRITQVDSLFNIVIHILPFRISD